MILDFFVNLRWQTHRPLNREARLATPMLRRQQAVAHSRYRRKSHDASIDDKALQWEDMVL